MEPSEGVTQELGESNIETVNGILKDPSEQRELDNDILSDQMKVDANDLTTNESLSDHPCESIRVNNLDSTDISKEDSDDLNDSSTLEISDNGTDSSVLSVYLDNAEQLETTTEKSLNKESLHLPQCRTKRSYVCGYCNMKTQNPREYLHHLKDAHGEGIRIFECDRCLYASKSIQKINRHNRMVHKVAKLPNIPQQNKVIKPKEEQLLQPLKKSPTNIAPMSRSPRESKSPRRYEEYEFTEDLDLDQEVDIPQITVSPLSPLKPMSKEFSCSECNFTTKIPKLLAKHEVKCHLKKKFFKCSKCSYATHLKSRYTKHMKYHKLPVVKCEFCDFSTPYRWNLDRHMKNHNREGGLLKCHLCNFKAQIKQSLTVHIANHHVSQVRVTDTFETEMINDITEEEMEMLRMERDEDPDALQVIPTSPSFTVSNFDVGNNKTVNSDRSNENLELFEPIPKKPKIKMTFKKMKISKDTSLQAMNERHDFQEDFVHPDDVVHRHGNVYLKTEKCKLCPFKAPFQIEVIRHMKKHHGSLFKSESRHNKKVKNVNLNKMNKMKRPQTYVEDEDIDSFTDEKCSFDHEGANLEQTNVNNKDCKKKTSFFEKLQEKLTMNNVENLVCQFCGHESKCLSESVRHQKLHLSAKNIYASTCSTRCQFCRHRCKTTDDLVTHLKSCTEARKNQLMENEKEQKIRVQHFNETLINNDDRHPMENRVFVWNNLAGSNDEEKHYKNKLEDDKSIMGESTASDASFSQDGSEYNTDADDSSRRKRKTHQVYKCHKCSFSSATASRFHVHIIAHLNKKPYSCSKCGYCSNWRWDITKHIKVKISRKDGHKDAEVLISDIIDERNYEKYDKYLCFVDRKVKSENARPLSKKNKSKHILDADDTDSSKSSPCPTPINNSSARKLPAPPKLTRAPNRKSIGSAPRKRTIEPIITGSQMVSEMDKISHENDAESDKKYSMKPPPLVAMGPLAQLHDQNGLNHSDSKAKVDDSVEASANYQIITDEGAVNTSLETLQLLASGTTNLSFLKNLQSLSGEGETNDAEVLSNQMRMLLWLNCLSREAEKKDGSENFEQGSSDTMKLVLDHEGNPEWKCSTCDFRDSEQETVVQHVSLAHSKKGPVSLLHAVHRCNVCGFAAGTKRHVLLHIESSHGGQGSIISRSEGQSIIEQEKNEERTFSCRICAFTCKKQSELKKHTSHHSEKPDCVFKCVMCPFYVATKNELFEHFNVHNNMNPAKENNSTFLSPEIKVKAQQEDNSPREFVCDLCPFETRSRAKLVHHRQFHRPRGLPFSCPKCSYNVTRQHLLTQHLRIHGIISEGGDDISPQTNGSCKTNHLMPSGSKSPSPSLTITPISTAHNSFKKSTIDSACLPTLSDELTKNLHDIPLVWVSKDSKYFKMFKCRHCPHVNLRKTNIQEHEKMHLSDTLPPGVGHQCQFCTYICINAGVMTSHLKVHSGALGKSHAIVDQALPNEDQLYMLASSSVNYNNKELKKTDEQRLYYCQHCPARFFFEKEVTIHSRFHSSNFANQCEKCNFKVREPQQLLSHAKVHTPEYQERTRTLMSMHPSAPSYPPVAGNSVTMEAFKSVVNSTFNECNKADKPGIKHNGFISNNLTNLHNISQPPPTSRFKCDKCPSTFSKMITLQYHQSLHSASNPFKCTRCTYATKTETQLVQHTALHDKEEKEKSMVAEALPVGNLPKSNSIQETLELLRKKSTSHNDSFDQPPIKLKLLKGETSGGNTKKQFKYYIEEQVPLSGVDLLKRKNQIEREMPKDSFKVPKLDIKSFKSRIPKPEDRIGNPRFHYPLHIDRSSGKSKEKRYKCRVCPSAFEKLDQFNVHLNLHGTDYKYKCRMCDYSVKFYANFMMHIKRHKYHENMDAQSKGIPNPSDDDPRFQPFIGEKQLHRDELPKEDKFSNKENQFDFDHTADMTTTEKQHIILQQKKGDIFKTKDEEVDRKVYYCQHCPYANIRRDGVDSHSLRHEENNGRGVYMCHFCDYTAAQPNFIREHTKVHFRPFKYVQPAGYMRHDKLEIFSICSGDVIENGGSNKRLIISHEDSVFLPPIKRVKIDDSETSQISSDDCFVDNGICVDFRLGDVVDAPAHMK